MLGPSVSTAIDMRPRRATSPQPIPAKRRREVRLAIEVAISNVFGVDADCLWTETRGVRDIAEARQVAMYLAHVTCRMSLTQVGEMFGRDRTTVAHACLRVEYRRDDPNFDRALDVLGWALPTLALRNPRHGRPKASTLLENEWL